MKSGNISFYAIIQLQRSIANCLLPFVKRSGIPIFIGTFFLLPFALSAQQHTFIQYSTKEGLPQSQVRCLFQDSCGFIWAGTLGGFSRFDGRDFVNFDRQDGLLNNQVNCIGATTSGELVIGTVGSISFYNAIGIRSFSLPKGFEESSVNCIIERGKGEYWIGTDDGLVIFQNDVMKFPDGNFPFAKSSVKQMAISNNELVVVTKEAVYSEQHSNSFSEIYRPVGDDVAVFDFVNRNKEKFIATKGRGLVRISENDTLFFGKESGLDASTITKLEWRKDELWIASRFGFYKFDGKRFTAFTEKNGLKTPDVRDILVDCEGNIWLATYGSGILKFTGEAFTAFTTSEGLSSDAVMSITQDTTGAIWFSTFDNGICRMANDTIVKFDLSEFSGNNRTWCSLRDGHGNLWFGTSDGLYLYDSGKWKHFTEEDGLPDRLVLSLFFETTKDLLLVGTANGLCYWDSRNPDVFLDLHNEISNIPQTRIRDLAQDRTGKMWMATREGVVTWYQDDIVIYTERHGLPENSILCVEVDNQNRIWVGTQNGLAVFSSGKFHPVKVDNISSGNAINFLKLSGGKLWVGTNSGLYSLAVSQHVNMDAPQFHHYVEEDGLRSLELNLNAVFEDNAGLLWFGTTEGVMLFNPAVDAIQNHTRPVVEILNVQLDLHDVDWTQYTPTIETRTGLPKNLEVGYKDNHFTFHFSGISTTYPENITYQYMLEGMDGEWKTTVAQFATYSNLSFDKYSFRVRSINKSGETSLEKKFTFTVLPPYWLTPWFIFLEVLIVAGIAYAIYYSRKKIITARHEKEKFELRSRLLVLEQQSLNSSMNRHFIFNALNSIQYYINRQDKLSANRYLSDFAKLIRKNLDSSQENHTTLRDEIERLELYLKLEHMRFRDKFEYSINVDENLDTDTTKVPAMLLQPFLENSIWHGILPKEAPGKLSVDITRSNGSIHFVITDDGIGIENSLKNKNGLDSHISKGMEITIGRIDLIKKMTDQHIELRGPYQMHNENGIPEGTRVEIILPANFQEFI
ncbi:MAG: two-component regulator propeller domain-containing protein [Flavobacteriales bacterium]|nr:two-component regulator propeller domain-containing protein [Flavobacteriales bacterium]